jgi:hypothetical protein
VRTVERTDVVESQEPAAEDVVAFGILAVEPPREVEQQFLEDALEKSRSVLPSITNTRIAARAWTGGLTSSKLHSYAGSAPFGCRNHFPQQHQQLVFSQTPDPDAPS